MNMGGCYWRTAESIWDCDMWTASIKGVGGRGGGCEEERGTLPD